VFHNLGILEELPSAFEVNSSYSLGIPKVSPLALEPDSSSSFA
jgi:hypothetical protein